MAAEPRPVVALLGSLDTKGAEYAFLAEEVTTAGGKALLIDTGILGEPTTPAHHGAAEVAALADTSLAELRRVGDRSEGMSAMAAGAQRLLAGLVAEGQVDAVLSIGGSNAAYVMADACVGLPLGLPKVLVSTVASGNTRDYVRHTDLTLINPIVDINGVNRINRPILQSAVRAAVAMAAQWRRRATTTQPPERPLAAVTMFGVTTECGSAVADRLTQQGWEALTFHCTGVGGAAMESLIRSGAVNAVADLTTTELADDLVGGDCSAGPDRLTAAGQLGIPQVVSVGALDMVNFWGRPVPDDYADRTLLSHNPTVTLMRTTPAECRELGMRLATKVNASTGPVAVLFPTRGLSQLSVPGGPFEDRQADEAMLAALRAELRPDIPLEVWETSINDPALAARAVEFLAGWTTPKENT